MLLSVGEAHRLHRLMRDGLLMLIPGFHLNILHFSFSLAYGLLCTVPQVSDFVRITLFLCELDPVRRRSTIRGA